MKSLTAALLLAAALLGGCQGEKKAGNAAAGGQVLPGSVSDAMLPLDTVRSQPPLAPKVESSGVTEKGKAGSGAPASEAGSDAPQPTDRATTVPAPTPEAAPE